jgi:hypothetical protein
MPRLAASALLAVLAAADVSAQDPEAAESFRRAVLAALASRDRAAIARMIKYPAVADVGGFKVPLVDRAATLELYGLVFTPELRCALERDGVGSASSGATLAGGRIRTVRDGGTLKIVSVTVPGASGAAPPPPSKPQLAYFRRGQSQFSGRLYGDGMDAYLVTARKGALLQARIERFAGRSAFVRVVDGTTGQPIGKPTGDAPRLWAGTLPADGQYRVEVVRVAPYCNPPFTYLLTMTMR